MKIEYVPLLRIQRELQGIHRGMGRFRQYLRTIWDHDSIDDALIPLLIMNPMGKDHVTALLDELLVLDADGVGARTVAEAASVLSDVTIDFKAALVVADDLMGGGTNRYDYEYTLRFGVPGLRSRAGPSFLKQPWLLGVLWSSEPPSVQAACEALLTAAYRAAYVIRHGPARTLREMMAQEGHVMATAGCTAPVLDPEDLDYTREVLDPFLEADDLRTAIECLFGDAAGRTLGFTPRGLSLWAGLAVALHDARAARDEEVTRRGNCGL